jgi:hypothetical protein
VVEVAEVVEVVEVVEVAEVVEVVEVAEEEEGEAPRVVDKQARRSEVRNANRGSISSKLVASPSSVDIVVDIVVDNVVDNNGPASFRHTSNMWVNPPLLSSSSSSSSLLLLVVLVVVVLPWRWWCSRRMVCVTRFKSHPKRRRWMVAMPSFFLFVCTKSFKMQFRSRLLRATTMASSSNTRLRKYWQNKS